ncbi:MAG: efflux RND transporter periplasmic adaptor subunit [Schleiferiaceae bacterium]|nr:efflux RND transporter periplasmic adaptor subunit [Schleiferiaceae bacterium]
MKIASLMPSALYAPFPKALLLLALTGFLGACNSAGQNDGLSAKKETLAEKEQTLKDLKKEISDLRADIKRLDTVARQQKVIPVQTKTVRPQPFDHFVKLTGTIKSEENVLLSAESTGRVEAIPAEEGQMVQKGDVLVQLKNDALRNQLQEAQAAFELAKTTYERRASLWKDSIGSEIQYLQSKTNYQSAQSRLEQLRSRYGNTFIKAPVTGKVDNIQVNVGEFLAMGQPVVRVIDLAHLYVEAELSEGYLEDVDVGDTVAVSVPALGITQRQPVTFVSQYINPANRSFMVRVNLATNSQRLKPNLLAQMKVRDYRNPQALVVPAMAVQRDLKGPYLFAVQQRDGKPVAEKVYVERGRSFGNKSEILSGLKPGTQVVSSGFNQLSNGDLVALPGR